MIPVLERFEHKEVWIDGLHFYFFSHDDLGEVIKASPYKLFSNSSNVSGWVIEHPSRQDDVEGSWFDDGYEFGTPF